LHQHLPAAGYGDLDHRAGHGIATGRGSVARRVLGDAPDVVSEHHQAVDRLAPGLRVTGTAPDGLVEALEVPGHRFALGVQWHPERCGADGGRRLGEALLQATAA
jgi:putative glutamine amidotransferase